MSVILTLADVIWTQGYGPIAVNVNITNSGTENIKNVQIKVTDSVVFDALTARAGLFVNCLNVFSTSSLRFYENGGYNFELPAGQTKRMMFNIEVKPGAPVQVHNLTCDFQYEVY